MGYQENWLPYFQKELGHEVLILTSDRYFPFPDYEKNVGNILGRREVGEGVFYCKGVKIIRARSFFELTSRASILFNVRKKISEFAPDVIHLHGITNLNLFQVLWCIRRTETKIFIDSHTDYQVSNYSSKLNRLYYKLWGCIYSVFGRRISCYLPTTSEGKDFIVNEFGVNDDKIEINYLGVNTDRFYYDSKKKDQLVSKYNLKDRIVIINAGKQNEGKKIVFILQVLQELINNFGHKSITLILIGDAAKDYDQIIDEEVRKTPDNVIRVPFLENSFLIDYYSLADIGIWPGIPSNTIQEAMACEVSVLLPENDTISHLIEDNGFFLSPFDCKETASLTDQLINSGLLNAYKTKSREVALRYSWKNIARESLELYATK